MSSVCILTDSAATFSHATFKGQDHVRLIASDVGGMPSPGINPPAVDDFTHEFGLLGGDFAAILVTLTSKALSPIATVAAQAATQYSGRAFVQVIDSQNIGAGLGLLVELAAEAAGAGESAHAVERLMRATIPHIYSLFCIPQLDHLAGSGYLSQAQATVGQMLGLFPIFMLEEGQLVPLEKVRTQRHLIESFQEFLEEFSAPKHIALMKGAQTRLRTRPLRQYVSELFPETSFSEHPLNPTLTALFGGQTIGLALMDLS
jgi:DegV family protein with EDD domain